jgi:S1-C subfamily serine protease
MRQPHTRAVLLGFLVLACPASSLGQENHITRAVDSVVQIVIMLPDASVRPVGTGFFVDSDMIVTAGHVYWQAGQSLTETKGTGMLARKFSADGSKGFQVPILMLKNDTQHDVATFMIDPSMIRAKWPDFVIKPLSLARTVFEMGEDVVLVGFFGPDPFPVAIRGIVAGLPPSTDLLLLDILANRGQSGGPVVSIRTGEVAGLLTSTVPTTYAPSKEASNSGICRAVRVEHIRALVSPSTR